MSYKKVILGILSLSVLALGGATISLADNNGNNGGNGNNGNQNDSHLFARGNEGGDAKKHEEEAKAVGSTLEVHITNNGKVLVRGAKVTAISGNVITANTLWGSANMVWVINSDTAKTKHVRRFGGSSTISEIAIGDFLSFQGVLVTATASPLTVDATIIKDWSNQKKNANFEGTVSSVTGTSFLLATKKSGNVTVNTTATTSIIKKIGDHNPEIAGVFADITVGSKIQTSGVLNNLTNILDANKVVIKNQVAVIPAPQVVGVIKTIAGTTAPTTFVFTSGGIDYTAKVSATTTLFTNSNVATTLTSFVIGQNVQVFGTVNADLSIDSPSIKNLSL